MNNLFLAASKGNSGSGMWMLIIFVGLMVLMYFSMIKPQKKQQQQRTQMLDKLQKGNTVILIDGLHAKVDSVNEEDKTIVVDADGIYLTFSKMAVQKILPAAPTSAAPETDKPETVETKTPVEETPETDKSQEESKPDDKN